MITEPDLDHFFGGLETRFEGSAEYSRHAARFISSNFSVFRYITGEPLLSDILADLIDPAGTHGQGDSFLFLFLELVEKRERGINICVTRILRGRLGSGRPIRVRREDRSLHGRYHDILLSDGDIGLGIENKPGPVQ